MQSFPLHRRQLRRTATVMLAAWVFALCSGVAHACLLPAAEQHESPVMSLPAEAAAMDPAAPAHEPFRHVHHAAVHQDDGPVEHSGKQACLKFCADESSALTKGKGSAADFPESLPLAATHWQQPALPSTLVPWQPVERPASVGPPLFLRLLRLTI